MVIREPACNGEVYPQGEQDAAPSEEGHPDPVLQGEAAKGLGQKVRGAGGYHLEGWQETPTPGPPIVPRRYVERPKRAT